MTQRHVDTEAVREAEAWFREHTRGGVDSRTLIESSVAGERHAATIVRAWLARDVPAPAGRDLTAVDVRDAVIVSPVGNEVDWRKVVRILNGIARPSGGVGQPDTAEPRIPTAAEIVDEYEASQLDDRSPRSWSLPAPPPDDVTVEGRGTEGLLRDLAGVLNTHGVDAHLNLHDFVLAKHAYESLLTLGSTVSYERTVVEGEPPAPEPKYAVSNWVRVPTTDGDTITVGAPALDRRPHPDARWDTRTETWEPQATEPCAADGPRDALGIVRCVRTAGHDGDHQAHDSWNLVTWGSSPASTAGGDTR